MALKSNDRLKVTILTDFTRGTRGEQNTCTLLQKLKKYNNVKICLYHSPDLRGFLKKILPQKFNEVIGLSHMKVRSNLNRYKCNNQNLFFFNYVIDMRL